MSKFVVVILPDENKADEGVRVLKDLHSDGALTLYSYAIVHRSPEGWLLTDEQQSRPPLGAGIGALVGGLTGMFAGPAGAAIGVAAGGILGAFRELFNLGVSEEFLDGVTSGLSPGKSAIMAEISEEEWVPQLDARMEAIGGIVVREYRDDFIDEQLKKRIEHNKADLAQAKAHLAAARAENVEKLTEAVARAEQKLHKALDSAKARAERYREETEAKIGALKDQAKRTRGDAQARITKRIDQLVAARNARAGEWYVD